MYRVCHIRTARQQAAHLPASEAADGANGTGTSPSSTVAVEAPEGSVVVDQSILDESSRMLEFLQKENAKYVP